MALIREHQAENWKTHIMGPSSGNDAFIVFEDDASEQKAVDGALEALVSAGILASASYDVNAYLRFQNGVKPHFEIPWTGISPRMRRTIYAINALYKPKNLVCAGIFCGYTFICNAGASIGPGACYEPDELVGLELLPEEAARAKRNVERFSPGHGDAIICSDAVTWIEESCVSEIDLLYIDAKAIEFDPKTAPSRSDERKSEYLKIVEAAIPKLRKGSLVLAHNSVNAVGEVGDYLSFVRGELFSVSVNLIIDDSGLEVSVFG